MPAELASDGEEFAELFDGDEPAEQFGDKEPVAPATNSKLVLPMYYYYYLGL